MIEFDNTEIIAIIGDHELTNSDGIHLGSITDKGIAVMATLMLAIIGEQGPIDAALVISAAYDHAVEFAIATKARRAQNN